MVVAMEVGRTAEDRDGVEEEGPVKDGVEEEGPVKGKGKVNYSSQNLNKQGCSLGNFRYSPEVVVVGVMVVVVEEAGGAVETEGWEVGGTAEDEEEGKGVADSAAVGE